MITADRHEKHLALEVKRLCAAMAPLPSCGNTLSEGWFPRRVWGVHNQHLSLLPDSLWPVQTGLPQAQGTVCVYFALWAVHTFLWASCLSCHLSPPCPSEGVASGPEPGFPPPTHFWPFLCPTALPRACHTHSSPTQFQLLETEELGVHTRCRGAGCRAKAQRHVLGLLSRRTLQD